MRNTEFMYNGDGSNIKPAGTAQGASAATIPGAVGVASVVDQNAKARRLASAWMLGLGLGLGFFYSKGKKLSTQNTLIYTLGSGLVFWGAYRAFTKTPNN